MSPAYIRYLKQVRRALCCSRAERSRLLGGLEQELLDAFPDARHSSFEQIAGQFGAPETMAQELQQALPGGAACAARRQIRGMWLGFLACLLLITAVAGAVVWREHERAINTPPEVLVVQQPPKVILVQPEPAAEPHPAPVCELPAAPYEEEQPEA